MSALDRIAVLARRLLDIQAEIAAGYEAAPMDAVATLPCGICAAMLTTTKSAIESGAPADNWQRVVALDRYGARRDVWICPKHDPQHALAYIRSL